MLKKIFGTIISKSITSICNFLVVILTAYYLGAQGRGEMAIIVMGFSIINLFQGLVGGSVLVYLTPRYHFFSILICSYIWAILMSLIVGSTLLLFKLYPGEYFKDLILITFLQGVLSANQLILLGKEKIKEQNILEITKAIILVLALLIHFVILKNLNLLSIIHSIYLSVLIPIIISFFYLKNHADGFRIVNIKFLIRDFFKYGFSMQLNQISQLFNYRFCFYLLDKFHGKATLGIFSIAIAIAETAWVICKSMGSIQYARISNSKDENYKTDLTVSFSKLSLMATIPVLIIMLILPENIYISLFGIEFKSIQTIMLSLAPGIIALSFFTIINHYYAGIGKNFVNVKGALIGNVSLLIFGFILIPKYAAIGAAIANSLAYIFMLVFLLGIFSKEQKINLTHFFPSKNDIRMAFFQLKSALTKIK